MNVLEETQGISRKDVGRDSHVDVASSGSSVDSEGRSDQGRDAANVTDSFSSNKFDARKEAIQAADEVQDSARN